MDKYTQEDKTLALVGIYQSAKMVLELANDGQTNTDVMKVAIDSLFIQNPTSTLEVYGNDMMNVQTGITVLLAQMSTDKNLQNRNIEITRYVLSMMVLAKKLRKDPTILNKISEILETAEHQRSHFSADHENVIATVARAYSETISHMSPRIMVNGHHTHLQNKRIANKIRTLLLSGIRSALLWYQVGGSRLNLIWTRKKYLRSAQNMHIAN
jgi:high frequency lysogenization protein